MTEGSIGSTVGVQSYALRGIPQEKHIIAPIILDTHPGYHILRYLLYFLKGRAFMTDQEEQGDKPKETSTISEVWVAVRERRELLKTYAIDAIVGIVIFLVFVGATMVVELVARITGQFGILIRIVGWSISALGAICGIGLAIRNAYDFIKLLFKGPPQETSRPKVASEGRAK